jgi:hypothetical protein
MGSNPERIGPKNMRQKCDLAVSGSLQNTLLLVYLDGFVVI